MSFPITLTVKDANGNTVGTTQITQDIADQLYSYYVQKLQNDQTALSNLLNAMLGDNARVEAIANALANNTDALEAIYKKIKERLKEDIIILRAVQPVVVQGNVQANAQLNQLFSTLANLLPLQMLATMFTAQKSTFESVLESVLPILVLVPILERLA